MNIIRFLFKLHILLDSQMNSQSKQQILSKGKRIDYQRLSLNDEKYGKSNKNTPATKTTSNNYTN